MDLQKTSQSCIIGNIPQLISNFIAMYTWEHTVKQAGRVQSSTIGSIRESVLSSKLGSILERVLIASLGHAWEHAWERTMKYVWKRAVKVCCMQHHVENRVQIIACVS